MPNRGPDDSSMAGLQHLQVMPPIIQTLCLGLNLRHSLCLSYLGSLSSVEMSVLIFCLEGGKMYIKTQRSQLKISSSRIYIKHQINRHLNQS
jgi:hypothetical protein